MNLTRETYHMEAPRTISKAHILLPTKSGHRSREIKAYDFMYTLVPSHDSTGKVDGVIIYAVDESEQRQEIAEVTSKEDTEI